MCVFNTWAEVAKYKVDFSRLIRHSFNRALLLLLFYVKYNYITFQCQEKVSKFQRLLNSNYVICLSGD